MKDYTSVVLGNSDVALLGEKEDVAFYPFVYCVLVIYDVAVLELLRYRISLFSLFLAVFHQNEQLTCFYFLFVQCRVLLA